MELQALAESVRNKMGLRMVKSQFRLLDGFGFLRQCSFDYPGTWDLELRDSPSSGSRARQLKARATTCALVALC